MAGETVQVQLPAKLIPLFTGPADVRAAKGGRGSGKTRSFAKMTAVMALIHAQAGREGVILCGRQFMNSLADTANMTETLSAIGICSGQQADEIIGKAQQALAAVQQRHAARGTWTLYPTELDTLQWLATLHARQLSECSYAEFERAFNLTRQRIAQARAGNAPRGAVVVEGDIAARCEVVA